MKIKHLILGAAVLFAAGCDTPSNTTGSTGSTGNNATSGSNTTATSNAPTPPSAAMTSSNASGTTANNGTTSNMSSTSSSSSDTIPGRTTASGTTNNTTTSQGTTSSGTNQGSAFSVPSNTQSAFKTRYPQATNVQWSRYNDVTAPIEWDLTDWPALDNDDYVVRYNVGADSYYAWYDQGGNWVGSSMRMNDVSTMPAAVNNVITSKFAGYTVSSVNMEYWKDRSAYEVEMKGSGNKVKLLVDANGNIIKQKIKPL